MDPSCLVPTVQGGGGGVMVWGMFSWHTLGPLVPIGHRLNATAYLSIVANHVRHFMATMYPSSDGYFQQDNAQCHKVQIISNWLLENDNEFTVLKWPPVTRSQPNRASLGWNGSFMPWMCIPQISINCKMLSYQYGPTFLKNAFSTLLNQCHIELR